MDNLEVKQKNAKRIKKSTIALRALAVLGATIVAAVVFLVSVLLIINYGPSKRAHKVFVYSVRETSALKFLAEWFTTDEELEKIIEENNIEQMEDVTDTGLIHIGVTPTPTPTPTAAPVTENQTVVPTPTEVPQVTPEITGLASDGRVYDDVISDEDGIIIVGVKGSTYTGRVMIVLDPSRVKVGVCNGLGNSGGRGQKLAAIISKYDAIAGINAGGFEDTNGHGLGSIPLGHVYSEGKLLSRGGTGQTFVGFNKDNVLIVGNISAEKAASLNIRDAVSFGPALIINGVSAEKNGVGSGLNPRTAIGQREDGAVLLVTIDGRQANSLGASYGDLIDIFERLGAVNAANLDGGSSTLMMYKDEIISNRANLISDRLLPDAFIVTK